MVTERGASVRDSETTDGDIGGATPSSFHNSQTGSSMAILREEDIPGASLNGREPSQLHVMELKRWLKCRGAPTTGRKQVLVKRLVIDI